ncbi:MAG: imelysin family protein [Pontiella sp.]
MKRCNMNVENWIRGGVLCAMVALVGCDSGPVISTVQPTESEVLAAWVNQSAMPSLNRVVATAEQMNGAIERLCESPTSETLQQAQSAWVEAYLAWRHAEPFLVGPAAAMDRQIGNGPVNRIVLDAAVDSEELAYMLKDSDVRGYAALEHLLFAPQQVAAVTTPGRSAHLVDLSAEIYTLSVRAKEQVEGDFYRDVIAAGNGDPYLVPAEALSLVFGEVLNVTERIMRNRIGEPSGYFRGPTQPLSVEAWESGAAQEGLRTAVAGLRLALWGAGEASIITLVATKDGLVEASNPQLAADLVKQLNRIQKTIEGLGGASLRLEVELAEHPNTFQRLYKQFQTLQNQLIEASLVLELDVHQGLLLIAPDAKAPLPK